MLQNADRGRNVESGFDSLTLPIPGIQFQGPATQFTAEFPTFVWISSGLSGTIPVDSGSDLITQRSYWLY